MRKWFVFVAAISIVVGAAGVASAAPLNWEGTLTVIIADNPPVDVTGGGVATVNDSAGVIPAHLSTLRLAESRGNIAGTETVFITDPELAANGVAAIIVDANLGTGSFRPISGGAASNNVLTGNLLPMKGIAKICILSTSCTSYVVLPLTEPTTVNGVPGTGNRGIGIGGLMTAGGYGGIRVSLQAAPWTLKTATVIDQITPTGGPPRIFTTWVAKGWAHAPVSTTTSTAQPSGVVQLVSPGQIQTNLPLGSSDKMAGLIILVVHFIPEPGLLLLLGSGVLGLTVLGRRRLRG
jgi:hypothetical protein